MALDTEMFVSTQSVRNVIGVASVEDVDLV